MHYYCTKYVSFSSGEIDNTQRSQYQCTGVQVFKHARICWKILIAPFAYLIKIYIHFLYRETLASLLAISVNNWQKLFHSAFTRNVIQYNQRPFFRCFWMLGILLDVGKVFRCWGCYRMLGMFFGCWGCFSNFTEFFPAIFSSKNVKDSKLSPNPPVIIMK